MKNVDLFLDLYRSRTNINEVLNLPNRIFLQLLNTKSKELSTKPGQEKEAAQTLVDDL